MKNQNLNLLNLVRSKFRDDIILRLSELSSSKHGRLNFHFASDKFKIQKQEVNEFKKYLQEKHLIFRRNKNIAHKQMSPKWDQIDPRPFISNSALVKAIAWAISIMKNFDKVLFRDNYKLLCENPDIGQKQILTNFYFFEQVGRCHFSKGVNYLSRNEEIYRDNIGLFNKQSEIMYNVEPVF